MKILTTALFSVILLNRSLSTRKWMALVLLTFGIGIVQVSNTSSNQTKNEHQWLGLAVVFIACILSGLAGVW